MIGNILKWLTDPAAIGRKRTIAAVAAIIAGALRGASSALHAACEAAAVVGALCSFNADGVAAYLDTFVGWLNAYVVPGADAVTMLMGLWGLWSARGKVAVVMPKGGASAGCVLLAILFCVAGPVSAQEAGILDPALATPAREPVQVGLYGGAMQFAERGQPDKRDFVYRLTLNVPAPQKLTLYGRADYTRTQDGGDLLDVKTFRSVEALVGLRRDLGSGFAVTAFSGVTWNRDEKIEPADPRLWTAAAGLRYSVPGRGYLVAAAGHHGPVGGSAFLGSLVVEINAGASWFADVAIPLDAARFAARPYTVKAGISARLKAWKF